MHNIAWSVFVRKGLPYFVSPLTINIELLVRILLIFCVDSAWKILKILEYIIHMYFYHKNNGSRLSLHIYFKKRIMKTDQMEAEISSFSVLGRNMNLLVPGRKKRIYCPELLRFCTGGTFYLMSHSGALYRPKATLVKWKTMHTNMYK